jgi:uncharacterized membrane protein YhaH (DUF805 family)
MSEIFIAVTFSIMILSLITIACFSIYLAINSRPGKDLLFSGWVVFGAQLFAISQVCAADLFGAAAALKFFPLTHGIAMGLIAIGLRRGYNASENRRRKMPTIVKDVVVAIPLLLATVAPMVLIVMSTERYYGRH